MKSTINFGIDLGTTNSAIAKSENGEIVIFKNPLNLKQTLHSVVSFKGDRIIVGDKAKEVLQKSPNNVFGSFKRKMGTSDKYFVDATSDFVSPIELSTIILKELKNFIHSGESPESVVITIPSAFDTTQSNATKKAGHKAGFKEVVLLQEPIAASLAFANKTGNDFEEEKWLVYDFGGGTFDVALTSIDDGEMKILDHEGDNYLGGTDFDKAIIDKFIVPQLEKLGSFVDLNSNLKKSSGTYNRLYNKLLYIAEDAKIELTNAQSTDIEFDITDNLGKELEFFVELTKTEFENIIRPYIERTMEMISSILNRNQLSKENLKCILLIGGSTYTPLVKEMLSDRFGIEVNSSMDPSSAVVVGAAYYAGQKPKTIVDTVEKKVSKNSLDVKVAYERAVQQDSTLLIAQTPKVSKGSTYRISRSDKGYDSGILPLENTIKTYLPLIENTYNLFEFKIFDNYGNKIHSENVGITHGKFSIDGQPLPSNICLEVDSIEDNTTFLEPIFKKGAILPLKKTVIKQVSKTISKGSKNAIFIKVIEGDIDSLPSANKLIGLIEIQGDDLERDLVKGSDIELTFEINESRDITVGTYLSITDQEYENTFSPSETTVNSNELLKETTFFKKNLRAKQKHYEHESSFEKAAEVTNLIEEVDELEYKIHSLDDDDTSDEKYKLDVQKRELAKKIHLFYNSSYLTTIIEKYFNEKKSTQRRLLDPKVEEMDQKEFKKMLENEVQVLRDGNISVIKMKIKQFDNIQTRINNRSEVSIEMYPFYFMMYKGSDYDKQEIANEWIAKGDEAVTTKNYAQLGIVISELAQLKKEEEKNNPDLFRNEGTGLK